MLDMQPRLLTESELNLLILANGGKGIGSDQFRAYTFEQVQALRIGRVNVLVASQEHDQNLYHGLPLPLSWCIRSNLTKQVVLEYFDPEIAYNAENTPIIGKFLKVEWETRATHSKSIRDQIAECTKYDKTVSVIDIANGVSFPADYASFLMTTGLAGSVLYFLANEQAVARSLDLGIIHGVYSIWHRYQAMAGKGFFQKEKINPSEKFMSDSEDARRVRLAQGVRQLAVEYQPLDPTIHSMNLPQILVIYPEAHARRIVNYLLDPTSLDKASRQVKQVIYRSNPFLEDSVRTYVWKDQLAKLTGDPTLARWGLSSKRSVGIFT